MVVVGIGIRVVVSVNEPGLNHAQNEVQAQPPGGAVLAGHPERQSRQACLKRRSLAHAESAPIWRNYTHHFAKQLEALMRGNAEAVLTTDEVASRLKVIGLSQGVDGFFLLLKKCQRPSIADVLAVWVATAGSMKR